VPTWQGFLFLAVVVDAYSRRCVGWSMRDDLRAELVVDALGMAVSARRPAAGLACHSDRGSQYLAIRYTERLAEAGVELAVGSRGDAYDCAAAESFMATLKTELVHRNTFKIRDAPQPCHPCFLRAPAGGGQAQEGRPGRLHAQAADHPQRDGP